MRLTIAAVALLALALCAANGAYCQSSSSPEPNFKLEIHPSPATAPTFTVANLTSKTLTAANFRFFYSTNAAESTEMVWDPISQGVDGSRPGLPGPLKPGASMTLNLPRIPGKPLPDKAELNAGICDDGKTFGDSVSVKLLLQLRSQMVQSYEQAIAFLQRGLEQKWTREQYLQPLASGSPSGPFRSIASTLRANDRPNQSASSLEREIGILLDHFKRSLDQLREPKP